MNIKEAKEEVLNTVRAYLLKDEDGSYYIPVIRQRPVLLMGPPGIGKTAIMEQIAREAGIGLVAYSITHHTRQSAVGLPFIEHKSYDGRDYAVTEYTMSEIIASVYNKIEETGLKEGILFIDEINCVSETLAPTMLQFLQAKMFGNHRIPTGWVIVAAGNPPEYNKSVHEFDIVTLDRVKKIDITEDFSVWKEYAYKEKVHGAILSYLEIKKENFYSVETTVDGKRFVTARGWEDLSGLIFAYEHLDIPVTEETVFEYVQHRTIARDFANYYELYKKYKDDYHIDDILNGKIDDVSIGRLKEASFDERLSVIGLLLGRLSESFIAYQILDGQVTELFGVTKLLKDAVENHNADFRQSLSTLTKEEMDRYQQEKAAGLLDKYQVKSRERMMGSLQDYGKEISFDGVYKQFNLLVEKRQQFCEETSAMLDAAFVFMEEAFGESQEMVIFVTELNTNYYAVSFISENECGKYYQYNKSLLFNDRQREILKEIQDVRVFLR